MAASDAFDTGGQHYGVLHRPTLGTLDDLQPNSADPDAKLKIVQEFPGANAYRPNLMPSGLNVITTICVSGFICRALIIATFLAPNVAKPSTRAPALLITGVGKTISMLLRATVR